MKTVFSILGLVFLSSCASAPSNRIPTFKEAVDQNPDLESGIYNKRNGENVAVEVTSLRAKLEEEQKKSYDAQREADYQKRTADQVQYENLLLRVKGNYKLEKQVNELQGFDGNKNPIVKQQTVNPEPQQMPPQTQAVERRAEPLAQVEPRHEASPSAPAKAPDLAQAPAPPLAQPAAPSVAQPNLAQASPAKAVPENNLAQPATAEPKSFPQTVKGEAPLAQEKVEVADLPKP
jgi:hypothetical protein